MARKLKTSQASLSFFDLAIAAPSMKAALEAWGSKTNLFQRGVTKEANDSAIVAATMAKPSVVPKRTVGSYGAFSENAKLPRRLLDIEPEEKPAKPKSAHGRDVDDKADRAAVIAFEAHRKRRKSEQRKEEAARERLHKRREQAIERSENAFDKAKQEYEASYPDGGKGVLCRHRAPVALAPLAIRWGMDASGDVIRENLRCSKCGRHGASLQHPGHASCGESWRAGLITPFRHSDAAEKQCPRMQTEGPFLMTGSPMVCRMSARCRVGFELKWWQAS